METSTVKKPNPDDFKSNWEFTKVTSNYHFDSNIMDPRWDTIHGLGKFEGDWDTEWLFDQALNEDLNEVDGTFACMLYHENQIYVFRNEISPLFKSDSTFSSTIFPGASTVTPNVYWKLDYNSDVLEQGFIFKTKENPYYFGE